MKMKKLKIVMIILAVLLVGICTLLLSARQMSRLYLVGEIDLGKDYVDEKKRIESMFSTDRSHGFIFLTKEDDINECFDEIENRLDIIIDDDFRNEVSDLINRKDMPTVIISPIKSGMLWTNREWSSDWPYITDIKYWGVDQFNIESTKIYVYTTKCTTFESYNKYYWWEV